MKFERPGKVLMFCFLVFMGFFSNAQVDSSATHWVDSVFNSLSPQERITQLMLLRVSEKTATGVNFYDDRIMDAINTYNIGGVVLFQGGPVKQANMVNRFQAAAKTPLLICIDAEWGLGMRYDSVLPLNHQLMLGAVQDASLMYDYGKLVAGQCKRAGIHVNYAPVVDINNNPLNPVINDRSFGEDKYKVALLGKAYMSGLQDNGVVACAKHFPGHGDVSVDSHKDLPVINKSTGALDSLELYPFKELFKAGVASVMVAHLYIPAIDSSANRATSISKKNVTGLLRDDLHYQGLTFTDALNMQGVAKFFPGGEISAEALIAGNDMLCLPADIPGSIEKINKAITDGLITEDDINRRCKKVLYAKYKYIGTKAAVIDTVHLAADLNKGLKEMKLKVATQAITLLSFSGKLPDLAIKNKKKKTTAYVGIGISADNAMAKNLKSNYNADAFYYNYSDSTNVDSLANVINKRYKNIIVGVHGYARYPANNFGISQSAIALANTLNNNPQAFTLVFGNPYAIKNFCDAPNLMACYEDDSLTQQIAVEFLKGKISATGTLPVTVCDKYKYGSGLIYNKNYLPAATPANTGFNQDSLIKIDSIVQAGINEHAFPGCVVLVAKDGNKIYEKAYGHYDFNDSSAVTTSSIFDMASVTKICATTLAIMKLYDEGKLDLTKKLSDYLGWVKGSNKENITIEDILLHQAGLVAFIPFYKETISDGKWPVTYIYHNVKSDSFNTRVAENLYLRSDWQDTMYNRILQSVVATTGKYVYSDNDFIFLGKIVEAISGQTLNNYVSQKFYEPLGLSFTGFKPSEHYTLSNIAPTENEAYFRLQHLRGDVHDPGAAMFGGVAGHAGLFSAADDLAVIMQMLLNGGVYKGRRYLDSSTITLFTAYNSSISRRGLGFDKPEKDNDTRPEPYPGKYVSPLTFGHTGFTGTCVWADPVNNLIFIFLSNRVNVPAADMDKLLKLNIRGKIHNQAYQAFHKN